MNASEFHASPAGAAYRQALATLSAMLMDGASPQAVAAFLVDLDTSAPLGVAMSISMAIEDAALPGTFAEAVFDILAS